MLSGPKPGAHQRHIRAAVGTLATLLLLPLLARPGPLRLCLFWCGNGCKARCNPNSVLSELQFHLLPPPARWSSRCLTWTSVSLYGQAGSCNSSRKTSALAHLATCLAHVCPTTFVGQPLPTGGGAVLRRRLLHHLWRRVCALLWWHSRLRVQLCQPRRRQWRVPPY